jgi:hypothetical protein
LRTMKTINQVYLFSTALLFFTAETPALSDYPSTSKLNLSLEIPPEYQNYARNGSYLNPTWVGEVPEWNYYDIFGNHLLEGFHLFNMSMNGNEKTEQSNISLHPILKKWLNGMVQVGDLTDNRGILAMVGDRVATQFTPYTFNQSLFCGARIDVFFDLLYGLNSVSFITSRISNTGAFGMYQEEPITTPNADWLHGIHLNKKVQDIFDIGATWIDMRNQVTGKSGSLDGNFNDSFPNSPSALYVYGFDGRCNLPRLKAYGEWAQSQEVFDGSFKPRPGNVATLNAHWDFLDQLKFGGEGYLVESRYKTTFSDPAYPGGDQEGSGKYLYSLVEDNDDKDQYPENGEDGKINAVPYGDPDGVIPVKYDKDKNNKYDFEEDFLNYDCDPPKSDLYFDRNNNGVPDDIEDDAYPDYPYVPSYYLPGERYMRQDPRTGKWIDDVVPAGKYAAGTSTGSSFRMDQQVSKGLSGFHLYGTYDIFPKLSLTLGGIYEGSEKNSYQMTYQDTSPAGLIYAPEKAINLYSLIGYQHDFAMDKKLTVKNYLRYVKDNIPNHTLTSIWGYDSLRFTNGVLYTTQVDPLDYRDAVVEMLIAEYSIFKNRGFNLTTRGKYEFTKHFPHLDFNYTDENISSLILTNKCEYIWLLPFLKDMYLIPKYKNIYEYDDYGPKSDYLSRSATLDSKYRHNTMSNNAYLVYEWKFTQKTSITTGYQFETFNDFNNAEENFYHGNWTLQLMIKDRYAGLNTILTTGVSKYNYVFYNSPGTQHNPFNNPYRITENISSYNLFLDVHCGF